MAGKMTYVMVAFCVYFLVDVNSSFIKPNNVPRVGRSNEADGPFDQSMMGYVIKTIPSKNIPRMGRRNYDSGNRYDIPKLYQLSPSDQQLFDVSMAGVKISGTDDGVSERESFCDGCRDSTVLLRAIKVNYCDGCLSALAFGPHLETACNLKLQGHLFDLQEVSLDVPYVDLIEVHGNPCCGFAGAGAVLMVTSRSFKLAFCGWYPEG
ncbi:unnamed protein product [Leptidea sinapis]|uniref:Uncharacterized protein n=1 Tax=Leptidea sinapis TaxID=189913 RepID=A0A5E4PN69_9NEOP|nr:unnamed protein product [Leptidea sinapis]